jgi:hypothetical protein
VEVACSRVGAGYDAKPARARGPVAVVRQERRAAGFGRAGGGRTRGGPAARTAGRARRAARYAAPGAWAVRARSSPPADGLARAGRTRAARHAPRRAGSSGAQTPSLKDVAVACCVRYVSGSGGSGDGTFSAPLQGRLREFRLRQQFTLELSGAAAVAAHGEGKEAHVCGGGIILECGTACRGISSGGQRCGRDRGTADVQHVGCDVSASTG